MSIYLSTTYMHVPSDFRCVCLFVCVAVCGLVNRLNNYITDQHESAIGGACFHWPQISLNLIHTRRQKRTRGRLHVFTHTHTGHRPIHPGNSHLLPCCANCLS